MARLLAKGDSRHLFLSLMGDIYLDDFSQQILNDKIVLVFGDTFSRPDGPERSVKR